MDVLTAAWTAAGGILLLEPSLAGLCARCATNSALVPVLAVVSKVFTAYDGWVDPAGCGLCPACTWGYRHPPLRAIAHEVIRNPPQLRPVNALEVGQLLDHPADPHTAIVVPLLPGRKHLLPTAQWGRITVDDVHLPWTASDVARLAVMRDLRAAGFGSHMLTHPAPTWAVLRRLPPNRRPDVQADWARLEPWRRRRPWLALAVHVTAPPAPAFVAPPRPGSTQ